MILSCESLHKANALLHKAPQNCSCHLLLADAIGQYRMLEFSERALESAGSDPLANNMGDEFPIEGSEWQVVQPTAVVHTNHYLHPRFAGQAGDLAHTHKRYDRVRQILEE